MKHKARTKAMSWLLSLALMLSLVPGMGLTAQAALPDKVYYRVYDYSDSKLTYTDNEIASSDVIEVTNDTDPFWGYDYWYVVNQNVEITDQIEVNGTVNLILCDDAKLTASRGVEVSEGNTLNIYGQSNGTGKLIATGYQGNAAIGGEGNYGGGTVNIHGGTVTATCDDIGAGIGGGYGAGGGTVTIYGGTVNAIGGSGGEMGGAGIGGGGDGGGGGTVNIYGGTVNAIGGGNGNSVGIGGGSGNNNHGSLTLGAGVKLETSSNYSTWTDSTSNTSTRTKCMKTSYTPPHTHNFTYSADGATITATCGADGCDLTEVGGKHTATLTIKPPANLVYDNKAKAATVENNINNDELTITYTKNNAVVAAESVKDPGYYNASVTLGGQTASVTFEIKDNTYTITIPATLTVANAGWNATDGITAYGEIAEDKKLTVTATSANEWKLKHSTDEIEYHLATEAGGAATTVWDFSVDELAEQDGTNKPMGAVVEEYINKPAGTYTDTVTFTASVGNRLSTITISGTELTYADGDTWAQIVERNPGKIYIAGSQNNLIWRAQDNPLYIGGSPVRPSDTIDPRASYQFVAD